MRADLIWITLLHLWLSLNLRIADPYTHEHDRDTFLLPQQDIEIISTTLAAAAELDRNTTAITSATTESISIT